VDPARQRHLRTLRVARAPGARDTNRGLQFLDLIQEGNIGFDGRRSTNSNIAAGYKFSTYATWVDPAGDHPLDRRPGRGPSAFPVHMIETINKIVRTSRQDVERDRAASRRRRSSPRSSAMPLEKVAPRFSRSQRSRCRWETPGRRPRKTPTSGDFIVGQRTRSSRSTAAIQSNPARDHPPACWPR